MNATSAPVRQSSEVLREIYLARKQRNPQYSTRAFARDIGMSQTLLSLIMSGKRNLTVTQAMKITASLESSKHAIEEADELLEIALKALPAGAKILKKRGEDTAVKAEIFYLDMEIARLKVISQWYHLPILDLSTTCDFVSDANWVAKRLGISAVEARDAMDRLVMLGMADLKQGEFKKVHSKIYFATKGSESAVRSYHLQMMDLARAQLSQTDQEAFDAREISGMTMAISKSRMKEAKEKIKAFKKELATFLTEGDECDEVYQLNVQLFPLTKKIKTNLGEQHEN